MANVIKPVDPAGRLDLLAVSCLNKALRLYGNPVLRVGMRAIEKDVAQAFFEAMGPDTEAGRMARKIVLAANEEMGTGGKR